MIHFFSKFIAMIKLLLSTPCLEKVVDCIWEPFRPNTTYAYMLFAGKLVIKITHTEDKVLLALHIDSCKRLADRIFWCSKVDLPVHL